MINKENFLKALETLDCCAIDYFNDFDRNKVIFNVCLDFIKEALNSEVFEPVEIFSDLNIIYLTGNNFEQVELDFNSKFGNFIYSYSCDEFLSQAGGYDKMSKLHYVQEICETYRGADLHECLKRVDEYSVTRLLIEVGLAEILYYLDEVK